MRPLSPESLLLVKHIRLKLIDLRDLAEDQTSHGLLDALERVVTHVVDVDPDDNNFGLLIASNWDGGVGSIGVQPVRLD